jgi:hypothetical protein
MNLETATILFASLVAAFIALPASPPAAPREVQVAHLASVQPEDGCTQQTWPHFSAACLRYANGSQKVERVRPVAASR